MRVSVSLIFTDTGRICETRIIETDSVASATAAMEASMVPAQRKMLHVQAGEYHGTRPTTTATPTL